MSSILQMGQLREEIRGKEQGRVLNPRLISCRGLPYETIVTELAPFVQDVARRNANSSPGLGVLSVPVATSTPCCSPALLPMEISGCLLPLVCSGDVDL